MTVPVEFPPGSIETPASRRLEREQKRAKQAEKALNLPKARRKREQELKAAAAKANALAESAEPEDPEESVAALEAWLKDKPKLKPGQIREAVGRARGALHDAAQCGWGDEELEALSASSRRF